MAGADLEIVVDGRWLSLECRWGDYEMSTEWPGGSKELSWTIDSQPNHRFKGGEFVDAVYGGVVVWSGRLLEPDSSQEQMVAQGAWHEGDDYAALTHTGAAGNGVDQSIDQAILRGLAWTRPATLSSTATDIDTTQGPVKLGDLIDTWADNNSVRWGVRPDRSVYAKADDTVPSYQTVPLEGGLGYALDNYASTLIARYFDSDTGAYETVTVTDDAAEAMHGHVEQIVDLTSRGPITATKATTFTTSLLHLGAAVPQWTKPIALSYGEILSMGGLPVDLAKVQAGTLLRVHGGWDLATRGNGAMFIDVPIGTTTLSGGLLTIQPGQIATRTLTDALALAIAKK